MLNRFTLSILRKENRQKPFFQNMVAVALWAVLEWGWFWLNNRGPHFGKYIKPHYCPYPMNISDKLLWANTVKHCILFAKMIKCKNWHASDFPLNILLKFLPQILSQVLLERRSISRQQMHTNSQIRKSWVERHYSSIECRTFYSNHQYISNISPVHSK